uniref:Major facilitator superfamily (MFS) profile domain-containing protein n=1 Tax=Timema genevievae TaxID=629358 RepID=A0A7R9K2L5_TIMGE|nr:unnamed protein product [Timema genevievae]
MDRTGSIFQARALDLVQSSLQALGTAWGYIESFLFWLLQDLGASGSLMGITITVAGIAGIPLLVLSGPIIDRIGHANVLFIGFIFYAIRLLGYSIIYNPWLCLIFEAMESVTSSLSFTAAVTYAAKLSSTTTDTSIQGLLGGIYFGVGKGVGSLIGGYLMKGFGTRSTFRIFSVMCTITGICYFLFNRFYLSRRPQSEGNEIGKKKVVPSTQDDCGQMEIAFTQNGEKTPGDIEKKAKSNRSNVESALSEAGKINESLVMDDESQNETEEEKNNVFFWNIFFTHNCTNNTCVLKVLDEQLCCSTKLITTEMIDVWVDKIFIFTVFITNAGTKGHSNPKAEVGFWDHQPPLAKELHKHNYQQPLLAVGLIAIDGEVKVRISSA